MQTTKCVLNYRFNTIPADKDYPSNRTNYNDDRRQDEDIHAFDDVDILL